MTDASRQDIGQYTDVPLERIQVVPNGVTELPVAKNPEFTLPDRPYLVYVGADDPHKNTELMVRLMRCEEASAYRLLMIGDLEKTRRRILTEGLENRIHCLGRLPDAEIGFILKNAMALLFPSLF